MRLTRPQETGSTLLNAAIAVTDMGKYMNPKKTLDDYQIESRDFLLGGKFRALMDEPGVLCR